MQLELVLVQSGVISADDYVAAVAKREEERPPLGQVAIEEGVLSVRRVLELLRSQDEGDGARFGEIAVERGYLGVEQVATLLMRQQERQRPLVEHLVELGRLSAEQVAGASQDLAWGDRRSPLPLEVAELV